MNYLYTGDCNDVMDSEIADESIDLVITSPPYDNIRDYKGYCFDFERTSLDLYRVLKKGGVVVWVVGDQVKNGSESGTSFRQALRFKEIGFSLYDTMIFGKLNYLPKTHRRYEQEFEYMFVLVKGNKPKVFNPIMVPSIYKGDKRRGYVQHGTDGIRSYINSPGEVNDYKIKGNVWYYATGRNNSSLDLISFEHPATFPEKLAEDHIYSWSNAGDTVLDPFMGSGTTGKMCTIWDRNFIGIEISEEYSRIAKKRIEIGYQEKENFFGV